MAIFKCKMCGGDLEVTDGMSVCICDYCGSTQTLPKLDNEERKNLYDRANHFRRNNDYDKAISIYENILNKDNSDAEAYWSLVLCKYGIEYVEDPLTHKRVPTVNRAQYTSVFADEDYKSAIKFADVYQKSIYESEAREIDEIQKGILEISEKEDPFDIFICYKETDYQGRRTPDSVLATELYNELTREGFKVFFSRITLEDKLGSAYEPYIFAALNSAKVMVTLGTKAEYFNAVWVKNEWSRFLALIKNGQKKTLIPAYRDMDPYDLPEEFSHLQAQDMSKLGFMQDLIRGISKIVSINNETKVTEEATQDSLIKRCYLFLEDGEYSKADEYTERVLDLDPYNHSAYFVKTLIDYKCSSIEHLKETANTLDENKNFSRAIKYSSGSDTQLYNLILDYVRKRKEKEIQKQLDEEKALLEQEINKEQQILDNCIHMLKEYENNIPLDNAKRIEIKKRIIEIDMSLSSLKYVDYNDELREMVSKLIEEYSKKGLAPNRIRCNHCGGEQSKAIRRCLWCGKLIDIE